jgi:replicative DNA helicase
LNKLLPSNEEFERIILASILLSPSKLFIIRSIIDEQDFYTEVHRHIYRAILQLSSDGNPIDKNTVCEQIRRNGKLDEFGGREYVRSITAGMVQPSSIEHFAKDVKEKSKLRQLASIGNELQSRAFSEEENASEIIQDVSRRFIGMNKLQGAYLSTGFEAINSTFKQIEERNRNPQSITGISSGLADLDEVSTGFQPGNLVVIAARTGIGKTALAINIAAHSILRKRKRVLIFSLEMTKQEIGIRMISGETGIDSYNLRTGYGLKGTWTAIKECAEELSTRKFWIVDNSITLPDLDAITRRLSEENGNLDLVIVDYLQLVKSGSKRIENRTQEVTEISRGLKAIAHDLKVPVIALSQLNSEGEVRESRAIEQDASLVIIIEMELAKLKSDEIVPAVLNIAKNRFGPVRSIECQFKKRLTRFECKTKGVTQ